MIGVTIFKDFIYKEMKVIIARDSILSGRRPSTNSPFWFWECIHCEGFVGNTVGFTTQPCKHISYERSQELMDEIMSLYRLRYM